MDGRAAFRLGVLGVLVGILLVLASDQVGSPYLGTLGLAVGLLSGATGGAVVLDEAAG